MITEIVMCHHHSLLSVWMKRLIHKYNNNSDLSPPPSFVFSSLEVSLPDISSILTLISLINRPGNNGSDLMGYTAKNISYKSSCMRYVFSYHVCGCNMQITKYVPAFHAQNIIFSFEIFQNVVCLRSFLHSSISVTTVRHNSFVLPLTK